MSEKTDVTKASKETQKFAMNELGYNGLNISNGRVYESL